MKKDDVFEEIKKKINVLQPEFKKQMDSVLEKVNQSFSLLYEIATKDEKTGIYNFKFFKEIMTMEIEKAKRGFQFSFIAIDIDHFKKVNDTYGHLTGDLILKELASRLTKEMRKYDVVSRFGGEEFLIILPNTTSKKGFKAAERIRKNLWKNKSLKKYKITISMGITEYKKKDTIDKIIARADEGLYISKKNGRNQTTLI